MDNIYTIKCDECWAELEILGVEDKEIFVKPCSRCMMDKFNEGHEDGYEEGYDAGSLKRGYEAGYQDGYRVGCEEGDSNGTT